MNVDKIFIKSFLHTFKDESFCVKFWDGDEVKVGENDPLFKIILKKPIPKKDILTSTTLAFGEAYMNGDLEVEGDFSLMLNTVLKYKDKFTTDFKGLPKIFSNLTSTKKQKEEVTYHYDIGNDFYKLMDYRELEKSGLLFDRVVSVGMLEHVGRSNYDLFMKCVSKVLKKEGVFVLHYISGLYESEGDAWIKKYIFPGGVIPTLREIISLSADYKFYTVDVESLRMHYYNTLIKWAENFEKNTDKVREMFDEKFVRMWRMYLYSCAACFYTGVIDLHQIVFTKGVNNSLPLTREYLYK